MLASDDPEVIESLQYLLVPSSEKIRYQALPYDAKKNFWVPNEKLGFVAGEIQSENGDDVTVKDSTGLVNNFSIYFIMI